jgi:undecaprenyl diphosphate synthase
LGIKFITLYAFSVENWNRPKDEVDTLMKYLLRFLKRELAEMSKNNIRLQAIGQIWRLPENIQDQLQKTTQATAKNNGITLTLALSYGGRTEIVDAVRQIAQEVKAGKLEAGEINEQVIAHHLYTHGTPDPDLLIRTSGEMRVSNFLLWQISYAEFVITKTLWPDFGKREFYAALEEYSQRQRRYGGV